MFVFRFVGWLVGTGILFSSDTLCIYPSAYPREAKVPAMNVISNLSSNTFTLLELVRLHRAVCTVMSLHMCPQRLVFPATAPRYARADSQPF